MVLSIYKEIAQDVFQGSSIRHHGWFGIAFDISLTKSSATVIERINQWKKTAAAAIPPPADADNHSGSRLRAGNFLLGAIEWFAEKKFPRLTWP